MAPPVRLLFGSALLSLVWGCGVDGLHVQGGDDAGTDASSEGGATDGSADAGPDTDAASDGGPEPRRYPGACTEILADGEGTVFRTSTNTYDNRGLILRRVTADASGDVIDRTEYIYDKRGLRIESRSDTGDDGSVDTSYRYTYNTSNQVITLEQLDTKDIVVWRVNYAYNEARQLVTATFWNQPDYSIVTYIQGMYGPVRAEYFGEEARLVGRLTYGYDASGKLTELLHEWLADASRSYRNTYTHDPNGNLLTLDTDFGLDDSVEQHSTYTYECFDTQR